MGEVLTFCENLGSPRILRKPQGVMVITRWGRLDQLTAATSSACGASVSSWISVTFLADFH